MGPLLTQALPAQSSAMIRSSIPFILFLGIFAIASGFDQNSEQQLADSKILKELTDHDVIRKGREALPKKDEARIDSKKKKQSKKGVKSARKEKKTSRKGKKKSKNVKKNPQRKGKKVKGKKRIKSSKKGTKKPNKVNKAERKEKKKSRKAAKANGKGKKKSDKVRKTKKE